MARTIWIGTNMAKENVTATNGGGGPLGAIRARISGGISGSAGRNVNPTYKTGTLAEPSKASVQVKPPARTLPAPKNDEKTFRQNVSSWQRGQDSPSANKPKFATDENNFTSKARQGRIINSKNQTTSGRASRPVDSPKSKSNKPVVKINSAPKKK